jgi:predicted transcriptional regulator
VLIQSVYTSLAGLGQAPAPVEKREPAVSVRSSVKADAITCLECGAKMKMLKRHLSTDHGLSPAEYRTRWHLAADYPMVAPDYAAKRKELAVKIGLGRKRRQLPRLRLRRKSRPRDERSEVAPA